MIIKLDKPNILGESPIWNYFNNSYYWVDIEDHKIKKFDDYYFEYNIYQNDRKIKPTCLALIDSNKIFTVVEDGFGVYDFRKKNGFNYVFIPDFIDENFKSNLRFNDGKCDRNGNLFIGTMDKNTPRKPIASIYKLFCNFTIKPIINDIHTSNGISFSLNNKKMYFSDTPTRNLFFQKDRLNQFGKLTKDNSLNQNDNIIIPTDENGENNNLEYNPYRLHDGSTVDSSDNYYSCLYGGYGIDIFETNDTSFNYLRSISTQKRYTTSCCFGGQNLDKLFITSAYNNDNDNGSAIIKEMDVTGIKETPINLNFTN